MTTPSLASLVTAATVASLRTLALGVLAAAGFPTTSWQETSEPRGLLEADIEVLQDLSQLVSDFAKGGYLDYAEEGWLTLLAKSAYQLDRKPAVTLVGTVRLTNATGSPIAVAAGQWIATVGGRRYLTTTGGTVSASSTLDVTVQAESPGADWNVGAGEITVVLTPIPGISVSNPANPSTGTWITTQGVDEERDDDLRKRCRARWGALGTGGNAAAYVYWALSASPQVTRVGALENTPADGYVTVTVAGPAGAIVDAAELAIITAYVEERRPLCVRKILVSATNHLVRVAGAITVRTASLSAAQTAAENALRALFAGYALGANVTVKVADLVETLGAIEGVVNVGLLNVLGAPARLVADDVTIGPTEVATYLNALTWVPV